MNKYARFRFATILAIASVVGFGCTERFPQDWISLEEGDIKEIRIWRGSELLSVTDPLSKEFFRKSLKIKYHEDSPGEAYGRSCRIQLRTQRGTFDGWITFTHPSLSFIILANHDDLRFSAALDRPIPPAFQELLNRVDGPDSSTSSP